ncbi:MAG: AmmeMemoRadiSam system protein B, partial [Candidatus Gracilibacteria bacterium]
ETPFGIVNTFDVRKEISPTENILDLPDAEKKEHSLEVQVPFLQMSLKDFDLYPLTLGNVRADFLANDLESFCRRDDVIIIVSSDLSHYNDYLTAKKIDKETVESILNLDIEKMIESGDACGRTGILTLMFLAKSLGLKPTLLDYRNSGDTAGGMAGVVGYSSIAFHK